MPFDRALHTIGGSVTCHAAADLSIARNTTTAGVIVLGDAGVQVVPSSLTRQAGTRARLGAGVPRSRQQSFTDIASLNADIVDIRQSSTYHP